MRNEILKKSRADLVIAICLFVAVLLFASTCPVKADWRDYLADHPHSAGLEVIIETVSEETDIDPNDLVSIAFHESSLFHTENSKVKLGDGGKSVGLMQLKSIWTKYCRKHLDKPEMSRYNLADNVRMAAEVLIYSGYFEDRMRALGKYNGGHKPYMPYARKVDKTAREIKNHE